MKEITDLEIIESILKGNYSDYALLIRRYQDKAFGMLRRMLRNEMDAEEALQDSFLKAYKSLSTFRNNSKFSTWFYKIVYNTALSRLSSKRRKEEEITSSLDTELILKTGDIAFETEDRNKLLNSLIEQLPVNYASVITMFYFEGMSCEEMAEVMNTSLSNVKVLLYRSRAALKKTITERKLEWQLK